MQATDPYSPELSLYNEGGVVRLRKRLIEAKDEIGAEELARMEGILDEEERTTESIRDAISTRLMEVFKGDRSRSCFGLLYELNGAHLVTQVAGRLRRYASRADARDVLQEVFFNVYRYPHRFNSAREDAFRVWSAMIVRNTVLKHLRSLSRGGRTEVNFEDIPDQPAPGALSPLSGAIESESRGECVQVYLTYLQLYLKFYGMLSEREQLALKLVEVDECSYREAAAQLEIKLENLKMVIFRARRKIHRSMKRVFEGRSHDCRPARDPRRTENCSNTRGNERKVVAPESPSDMNSSVGQHGTTASERTGPEGAGE
ncbi:MAG: RNA polymerase sigma factor (sigma-70 family) [Candidatus Paceibacteria bacterium]|jgi:RNA polymerase sigma factor (sigma-70 family)